MERSIAALELRKNRIRHNTSFNFLKGRAVVLLMRAENAGKVLAAIEGDPGELAAVVLPLLDGALEILPHTGEKAHKLRSRWRQRRALSAAFKNRKAHLVLKELYLIGQGRLADEHFSAARLKIKARESSMQ